MNYWSYAVLSILSNQMFTCHVERRKLKDGGGDGKQKFPDFCIIFAIEDA